MMLQALIAYAGREQLGDPDFEATAIHWLLPISPEGSLSGPPIPLYEDAEAKRPQPRRLPRPFTSPNELNQGDKSHFLADSLERALLFPNPKAPERLESRRAPHAYFKQLLTDAARACPLAAPRLQALLHFLNEPTLLARAQAAFTELRAKPTDNVAFQVAGVSLLDDPEIQAFWRKRRRALRTATPRTRRICLATGQLSETLDTTEKIRGVPGGLAMGTNLISFDKDSFTSFGLEQAQNAAISAEAELQVRSALNRLIADGLRLGEAVHLHWTREPVPTDIFSLLEAADEAAVRNLLTAPRTGHVPTGRAANAYYALSLSGNGGRIVVRDWLESTVPEIEAAVGRWFRDLTLIQPDGTGTESAFKLGRLLFALVRDKLDELPPQVSTQLLHAALRGAPLPLTALAAALRRLQIDAGQPPESGPLRPHQSLSAPLSEPHHPAPSTPD